MFFFCDTETTGLLEPDVTNIDLQPRMTEIYACVTDVDFNIIGEIETLVNPRMPIPDNIQRITNITDEMVADAPTFIEIFDELYDLTRMSEVFVAHNASFDSGVIRHELERVDLVYNFPWWRYQHCTVEMSTSIQHKRLTLTKLHELATGKSHFNNTHRAKPDVMALLRCYKFLMKEGFVK